MYYFWLTIGTLLLLTLYFVWQYYLYDEVRTQCNGCGKHYCGTMHKGERWYYNHECEDRNV